MMILDGISPKKWRFGTEFPLKNDDFALISLHLKG